MNQKELALFVIVAVVEIIVGVYLSLLYSTSSTSSGPCFHKPAAMVNDKNVCARAGIDMLNYSERGEEAKDYAGNSRIKYMGKEMDCQVGSPSLVNSSCLIGTASGGKGINISTDGEQCFVQDTYEVPEDKIGRYKFECDEDLHLILLVLDVIVFLVTIALFIKKKK